MSWEHENGKAPEMQDNVTDKDEVDDETAEVMTKDKEMDDDSTYEGVPVDTGWAWVIAISVHLMMTLIFGYDRAMSVLFVDFTEQFDQSTTVISLMFTVEALSSSIGALFIASKIMPRFSIRSICCVTGLLTSLVTICISQAPNIVVFLMLFIFKGLFFEAILLGGLTIIGYYFKKRRSLATSMACAGLCMAYITIPPITEMLRLQYGTRGCLLVLAGIELHVVFFGLFLRPVESYRQIHAKRVKKQELEERKSSIHNSPVFKTATNGELTDSNATQSKLVVKSSDGTVEEHIQLLNTARDKECVTCEEDCKTLKRHDEEDSPSDVGYEITNSIKTDHLLTENGSPPLESHSLSPSLSNKESSQILGNSLDSSGFLGHSERSHIQNTEHSCGKTTDSAHANAETKVTDASSANGDKCPTNTVTSTSCHESKKDNRIHNFKKLSSNFGSQLSHLSAISASHTDLSFVPPGYIADIEEIHDDDNDDNNNEKSCSHWLKDVVDCSLFKIWRFRMIALFQTFGVYTHFLSMYMPAIGYTSGISKSDAALLLTMSGVMDLATRVVMGYIGDYPWVSISKVVAFSTMVIAIVSQLTRFITTYSHFVVFALVSGSLAGIRQNFSAVLQMEYIGVEKFSKGFAITSMLATLSLSVTFPAIGAMVDATESFVMPLHFTGAVLFCVSVLLFCEPIFRKLDEKNVANQKTDKELAAK